MMTSCKEGREQLSTELSLCWAVLPKCWNHVEVIWFLFHFNHQSQRKPSNMDVPSLAKQLPCSWAVWCALRQDASLSGSGQETNVASDGGSNDASEFLSFQFVHFHYHRQQRWKIAGVSTLLPFVTLTKSAPLALWLQNEASWFQPRSKRPHLPRHTASSSGISFSLTRGTNTQMYCSSLISRKSSVRICTSSWLMLRLLPRWLLPPEPSCSSDPVWFIYVSGGICHISARKAPLGFCWSDYKLKVIFFQAVWWTTWKQQREAVCPWTLWSTWHLRQDLSFFTASFLCYFTSSSSDLHTQKGVAADFFF